MIWFQLSNVRLISLPYKAPRPFGKSAETAFGCAGVADHRDGSLNAAAMPLTLAAAKMIPRT